MGYPQITVVPGAKNQARAFSLVTNKLIANGVCKMSHWRSVISILIQLALLLRVGQWVNQGSPLAPDGHLGKEPE